MIDFLEHIDREVLFAINGSYNARLDTIFWGISKEVFGIPFYLFFLIALYKTFGGRNTLYFLVAGAITIGLSDLTCKYLFKEVFERYRPSHNLEIQDQLHFVNNYQGGWFGFISSHASNMFAITTLFYLLVRKQVPKTMLLIFLFPALVAYSRVYLGVHYPSDVFVGALWGSFLAWIIYRILAPLIPTKTQE